MNTTSEHTTSPHTELNQRKEKITEGNLDNDLSGEKIEDIAGVIPISGSAGPTSTKTFDPHGHVDSNGHVEHGSIPPAVNESFISDRNTKNTKGSGLESGVAGSSGGDIGSDLNAAQRV